MHTPLRGNPSDLRQVLPSNGTFPKPGYFGTLYSVDDPDLYSTELPTNVFNVSGHMSMMIPVIVPTLTREELTHLVVGGQPTWGMVEKAKAHAEQRIAVGKSPFAEVGEQHTLPEA